MDLKTLIEQRRANVAVIGLGHAGLPLAVELAKAGFPVLGIDSDLERVELLTEGGSYLVDAPSEEVSSLIKSGRLRVSSQTEILDDAQVIIICVPTPLRDDLPDMSFIESAGKSVAATLKRGDLVILASTTYPGTTEEFIRNILEMSGLRAGEDFYLGYSPERIDSGNPKAGIRELPKIVGGINAESTELIESFYRTFAYKPDVSDIRESPALQIIGLLRSAGARVQFHDPYIDRIRIGDEYLESTSLDDESLDRADLVLVTTPHASYDWSLVAARARKILDTRNALKGESGPIVKL